MTRTNQEAVAQSAKQSKDRPKHEGEWPKQGPEWPKQTRERPNAAEQELVHPGVRVVRDIIGVPPGGAADHITGMR